MRSLLPPGPDPDDEALAAAYAYPPDRSWLRANMVSSTDGAATHGGVSAGVSSDTDRRLFMLMRGLADAVIVGANTVRLEGYGPARPRPEYAERRAASGQSPAPVIAVVSRSLDIDWSSRLFHEATTRTIVVTCATAPGELLADARKVADVVLAGDDRVDLGQMLIELAERGHRRLLCEGGPYLLGQLVVDGLLDELCLTISPLLAGGPSPRILTGPPPLEPTLLRLAGLLEEDGFLFARYHLVHT